jgi:hypothetical protein
MSEGNSTTKSGRKRIIRAGDKFGKLEIVRFIRKSRDKRNSWYECKCECGSLTIIRKSTFLNQNNVSCGCWRRRTGETTTTYKHGMSKSAEWRAWRAAKERCDDPSHQLWPIYGARGIKFCDRWRGPDGFRNFIDDMGMKPGPKYSIERKDTNGNYEKNNCIWATVKQQNRNKRNNRLVTYRGETHCVGEWAEILGLEYRMLFKRLYAGWSFERAVVNCNKRR